MLFNLMISLLFLQAGGGAAHVLSDCFSYYGYAATGPLRNPDPVLYTQSTKVKTLKPSAVGNRLRWQTAPHAMRSNGIKSTIPALFFFFFNLCYFSLSLFQHVSVHLNRCEMSWFHLLPLFLFPSRLAEVVTHLREKLHLRQRAKMHKRSMRLFFFHHAVSQGLSRQHMQWRTLSSHW